jgi:hypothetical protein
MRIRNHCSSLLPRVVVASVVLLGGMAWAVPVKPSAPVHAWLLDEGLGVTTADRSGGHDGFLHGNADWSTNTPFAYSGNHSADFDGVSGTRVNFPGHAFGTQGTVQCWVYRDFDHIGPYVMDSSASHRTLLYRNSATSWYLYVNNSAIGSANISLIPQDEWTHIAVVWDNSLATGQEKIYKDGSLFQSYDKPISAKNPTMLWLGSRYSNNSAWQGQLDEFAFWGEALSGDEVEWLSQNSLQQFPAYEPPQKRPSPPAVAWLLDEGTGTVAHPEYGTTQGSLLGGAGWSTNTPFAYPGNHSADFPSAASTRVEFPGRPFGTQGSVACWVYRDFDGTGPYVMDTSNGSRTLLYMTSGSLWNLYLNQTNVGNMPEWLIPEGQWTHIAIVWDDAGGTDEQQVYRNGMLAFTFNRDISAVEPALIFLGNRYSRASGWQGQIDEFAMWDHALTAEEVAWLSRHSVSEIPEPATLVLLAGGLVAALRRRRTR